MLRAMTDKLPSLTIGPIEVVTRNPKRRVKCTVSCTSNGLTYTSEALCKPVKQVRCFTDLASSLQKACGCGGPPSVQPPKQ